MVCKCQPQTIKTDSLIFVIDCKINYLTQSPGYNRAILFDRDNKVFSVNTYRYNELLANEYKLNLIDYKLLEWQKYSNEQTRLLNKNKIALISIK